MFLAFGEVLSFNFDQDKSKHWKTTSTYVNAQFIVGPWRLELKWFQVAARGV